MKREVKNDRFILDASYTSTRCDMLTVSRVFGVRQWTENLVVMAGQTH